MAGKKATAPAGVPRAAAGRAPAAQARRGGIASTRVKDRGRLPERMRPATRRRLFFESTVFDFILVLLVAVSLTLTASFGFNSAWYYRGDIALVTLITLPLLVALFISMWSKRAVWVSVAATVAVCVLIVGTAVSISPDPLFVPRSGIDANYGWVDLNDTGNSYGIFAAVLCVCTVATYLLSRRTWGLVLLLFAVVVTCGVIQFLYPEWGTQSLGIPVTAAALLGVGMLFIYQSYKQSIYSANRLKRTSFGGAFGFSLLVAAFCVVVGAIGFYGLVNTLGLTTPDMTIFTRYVSQPEGEYDQTYQHSDAEGDETTSETSEDTRETNEEGEGGSEAGDNTGGVLENSLLAQAIRDAIGDNEDGDDAPDDINYLVIQWMAIIIAVSAVLLVVLVILAQRARRGLRLRWIARRSNAYQVWYLYQFLLKRFGRMGFRNARNLTPLEFAVGYSRAMRPFTRDAGNVDFVAVSNLYQDVVFGSYQPTEADMAALKRYYRAFFKNARRYVGWPKWILWKYWRI